MKCLICEKYYNAAECPRCHFPDIQLVGDRDTALAAMMPTINQYRANFLRSVRVSLAMYWWKDAGGKVVLDRQEKRFIATADQLLEKEVWLDERFARIADQASVTVSVEITLGDENRTLQISVPNLQKPKLQQLGAGVDSNYRLYLLLRNEMEEPTRSEPVALFCE